MESRHLSEKVTTQLQPFNTFFSEIEKVIVGQRGIVDRLLIGLLTNGHVLVEGVPGLAKTLTIKTMADLIGDTTFQRIQFTPDLLPADLIGTLVFEPKRGEFTVKKGPIFHNIILSDEINRAPAKVQSALLEAMQEHQVTIGGQTFALDEPFLVMATQNPIEQEGTYPLPEAQVDRFMLKVKIGYPNKKEELEIINRMSGMDTPKVSEVVSKGYIMDTRSVIADIYVDEKIKNYILDVVFATREPRAYELPLDHLIQVGASPRASISLIRAAKAHAFLRGRAYVTPQDVKSIGLDILRHRVIVSYEAEAESMTSDDIVTKIFDHIDVP